MVVVECGCVDRPQITGLRLNSIARSDEVSASLELLIMR